MSCRLLKGTFSSIIIPFPQTRSIHVCTPKGSVLDYFRKKTPTDVVAKEESGDTDEQIFSLEETITPPLSEEEINQKRNKSRLRAYHQRLVNGQVPHPEPVFWTHHTVEYKRRIFGKYGEASEVDPRILWPTRKQLKKKIEYENICNPFTIQEMITKTRKMKAAEEEAFEQREREVDEKMKLVDKYKADLFAKQQAKDKEQKDAKDRKEKLMEEVRRHFGFTVDSRDERFQEMLAKKEKEQRKAMKEAKKLEKQQKMLDKLEAESSKSQPKQKPTPIVDED